ncbi:SCO1/SenC-domain-containing protein [Halteromyces radiatus]|uniref:SCO1/SenC-domain-containing protein n=1 Tax=Halteromyces radiatus TaxID=101107 RepID=UPI002220AF3E|nr:SCO1/SenC-domain-containing protein [Halteromyces radiatus]KAI8084557.1 SCO1/SenC-domain-containing protein [Halteromyces radiatus]
MSLFTKAMIRATLRTSTRPIFQRSCQVGLRRRLFATSSEEAKRQQAFGPFTWKAAAAFLGTGAGLLIYFQSEKKRVEEERIAKEQEKTKSYGKPKIGAPFTLTNAATGKLSSSDDFKGQFYMVYFGFTHCPDICPEELDKMAEVVDNVKEDKELGEGILVPVFITCDPRRDSAEIVKEYIQDFHPDMVGFTGDQESIRQVAKSFRVYVSSPPNVADGEDYLVDHSIFFYLMDPEGKFVDCYAKDTTADQVTESFKNYVKEYVDQGGSLKARSSSSS